MVVITMEDLAIIMEDITMVAITMVDQLTVGMGLPIAEGQNVDQDQSVVDIIMEDQLEGSTMEDLVLPIVEEPNVGLVPMALDQMDITQVHMDQVQTQVSWLEY